MLNIENLTIGYGKNIVIENLDWKIQKGEVHGLLGLNGSGKTTLLNGIAGHLKVFKGRILIENGNIKNSDISYMETEPFFYSHISGMDYLNFFSYKNKEFSIDGWNELFHLPLKDAVATYSTGMRKKLALMGVMALDREIILLDEPFNGIDLETVEILKKIVRRLKETGKTVILTSHIIETLTDCCENISFLDKKKIACTIPKCDFSDIISKIFDSKSSTIEEVLKRLL